MVLFAAESGWILKFEWYSNFKSIRDVSSFMSRFWRLLEAWAKVVLTPTRFEDKRAVAVRGSWSWGSWFGGS